MAVFYSSNVAYDVDRFLRHEDDCLSRLPTCSICGEPIQQETAVRFDENDYICDDCLDSCRVSI